MFLDGGISERGRDPGAAPLGVDRGDMKVHERDVRTSRYRNTPFINRTAQDLTAVSLVLTPEEH